MTPPVGGAITSGWLVVPAPGRAVRPDATERTVSPGAAVCPDLESVSVGLPSRSLRSRLSVIRASLGSPALALSAHARAVVYLRAPRLASGARG
jgi:hypothetical protein